MEGEGGGGASKKNDTRLRNALSVIFEAVFLKIYEGDYSCLGVGGNGIFPHSDPPLCTPLEFFLIFVHDFMSTTYFFKERVNVNKNKTRRTAVHHLVAGCPSC